MWRRIRIPVLIGLLLAGVVLLVLRKDEPTYQNRRISLILDDWVARKPGIPINEALAKIGTNALPYAVRNLAQNDSVWRKKYRETLPTLPKFLKQILPQPKPAFEVGHGANVFHIIGPVAVPQAIALLKHGNPSVRLAAALGLGSLRRQYTAANAAIPALAEALRDPERLVRLSAALALSEMGSDASNAVPALTRVLADVGIGPQTNAFFSLRAAAAVALGKIGPAAKDALPTLENTLQAPNSTLRGQAVVAIWRITGDVDTALPVLLQEMPLADQLPKWEWVVALGEMGPRARAAIPQLEQELKRYEAGWFLGHVTNALLKIDPEAAAKVGVFPAATRK